MSKPIDVWCNEIHAWALDQGFYEEWTPLLFEAHPEVVHMWLSERIALMHEECTELLGAVREGDEDHELEELADIVIRAFDYAAFRGFALEAAISAKMDINRTQPYRHGRTVF